jgi:hypothetical protein
MFVLLTSFIFSISGASLNDESDTRSKSKKSVSSIIRDKYHSDLKFLVDPVDSYKCLDSYTVALAKLKLASRVGLDENSVQIKDADSEASDALGDFQTECSKTYAATACKTITDTLVATPAKASATEFESKCLVKAAAENDAGCYDAYEALVTLIDKQKTGSRKNALKAAGVEEFGAFVTKCLKTAQAGTCYASIKTISPETVGYTDLASFKTDCSVEKPAPAGGTDASFFAILLNSQLLYALCITIGLYFMI